ncbi:MAG TPA: hypothetical protein VHR45_11025 [Thermoanaerobaculia bacterium]|nr:hypothetical protein [Thermoanaerobaculia bacterium]
MAELSTIEWTETSWNLLLHPSSTHRYDHFFYDPLRAAADRITAEIDAAGRGGLPAEVIPFNPAH